MSPRVWGWSATTKIWARRWVIGGLKAARTFIGPNTLRDTASKLPENFFNYTYTGYMNDIRVRNQMFATEMIDARAGLLDRERLITGDRYTFVRNAYLQNREYKVRDGNVPDEF